MRFIAFALFVLGVGGHLSGRMPTLDCIYYIALAAYCMTLAIYDKVEKAV